MSRNVDRDDHADILVQISARQHLASNPQASAWVSANAGSGKTYVLAQRVVRLLLAGVEPSKILCLTFTKAAAAEMANRVFQQLASWTLFGDEELAKALEKVGEPNLGKNKLRVARRLFTRALETPGGLKIQTIHAFCESLLHRFTLEANISGHFEVMGSVEQSLMLRQAREHVFSNPHDPDAFTQALEKALKFGSGDAFTKGLTELIHGREAFGKWISHHDDDVKTGIHAMAGRLGIDYGMGEPEFCQGLLDQLPVEEPRLIEIGIAAGNVDSKEAQRIHNTLARYDVNSCASEKISLRFSLLLTTAGKIRAKIGEGKLHKLVSGMKEEFDHELAVASDVLESYRQWQMLRGSEGLFEIADQVLEEYQYRKQRQSYLDYDDLINKTADLLLRSDVRSWIHYKLDQGIDHVLVDEAQDTSPTQWQIIDGIVAEYFTGQSSGVSNRTMFAVGDQKQSIYSFQGALPEMFNLQKTALAKRAESVGRDFNNVALPVSFRSTRDVLEAVDLVFHDAAMRKGLQDGDVGFIHEPSRQSDPGKVVIWPMEMPRESTPKEEWWQPLDILSDESPAVRLAKNIARKIRFWIDTGEILEGHGRKIQYGDILILVRHRDQFASAITRELKDAGLNVAGADRLTLNEHIAIEDLLALAKWALLPQDDLMLAALFKSPLLGLSEDQLFETAHGRGEKTLWQALCDPDAVWDKPLNEAIAFLDHFLDCVNLMRPFEFFSEILSKFEGRKKFKSRLGDEVDDVLDAFLHEALNHDLSGGNGLMGFVDSMESASQQIKREIDLKRDEIRVMTVHSAKGLEAPIVFLVDSGKEVSSSRHKPKIAKTRIGEEELFLWQPDKGTAIQNNEPFYQNHKIKDEEEYRRLLYVGMTRAADRLIVCGFGSKTSARNHTWLPMIKDALIQSALAVERDGIVEEWIWTSKHQLRKASKIIAQSTEIKPEMPGLPQWAQPYENADNSYTPPISPSLAGAIVQAQMEGVGEQNAETGNDRRNFAIERGNAVHRLLQSLSAAPEKTRAMIAANYLETHFSNWSQNQCEQVLSEVFSVISDPHFYTIFGSHSQSEVGISGRIDINGNSRAISGQIDRLIINKDEVVIIDYKTDRNIPDIPEKIGEQYLIQLALYAKILGQIYPDKNILAALLWTSKPYLMPVSSDILDAALKQYAGDKISI